MRNLIRKILKEENDEFEWAKGLDISIAEKEIKKPFRDMEYEYSFEGDDFYDILIEGGVTDIDKLKDIGEFVLDELRGVNDRGYDSGIESCDCDGCCDDYVWYEDHHDQVRDARQEGYDEGQDAGYENGKEESESKIEELEGQIQELQSTISELQDTIEELHNRVTDEE
jgi:hypothetical protein